MSELELKLKLTKLFGSESIVDGVMNKIGFDLLQRYEDYKHLKDQNVAVLFSGGLDTSFWAHFLAHVIGAKVTTFSGDVGSVTAPANMAEVAARSKEVGAAYHVVVDCRDELAELGMKAVMAEAQLGNGHGHHPASCLARIVLVGALIKYCKANGIKAAFHGSNGSQNNGFRFHSAFQHFQRIEDYQVEECRPNLGKTSVARNIQQIYLQAANISLLSENFEENVSHDRNLLGDEWEEAGIANPENLYDIRDTALKGVVVPETPLEISVKFENGRAVAIKSSEDEGLKYMGLTEIFETLNKVGLGYHIGINDYPEGRPIGLRAREKHIQPGFAILVKAHNLLRAYNCDDYVNGRLIELSQHWSRWVMEKNMYLHPECQRMNDVFELFNHGLDGKINLVLEDGKIINITSPDAAKHMEGTKTPATAEEVDDYVQNKYAPDALEKAEAELEQIIAQLPEDNRPGTWMERMQLARRRNNRAQSHYNDEDLDRLEQLEKTTQRLDRWDFISTLR